MRQSTFSRASLLVALFGAILIGGCDDNTTQPVDDHTGHVLTVDFSYAPNPATVNTEIELEFVAKEGTEHVALSMVSCETGLSGSTTHTDMTVTASSTEVGHYHGSRTFTQAGTYDVHFKYMHDNEMAEKEFSITIQ